jgi:hypothetical protein
MVAKLVFGAAYAAVFGEVFLRLLAPVPILPRYVCATSFGIRGNMPNRSYWQRTPDVQANIRTNSKGIRADREIPYEKPPGIKRIVVLGDSFGMGYEVDLKDSFLTKMQENLEQAGIRCEVVNLSVSGHGNAEELLMLRHEGFRYQPDLVLVAWHVTDLEDNVRSNLFGVRDGRLVGLAKEYLPGVRLREKLDRITPYRWMDENSHLYTFVREKAAITTKGLLVALRGGQAQAGGAAESKRVMTATTRPATPCALPYEDRLSLALLKEMSRESREHGAGMLVLDIPVRLSRSEFVSSFPRDATGGPEELRVVSPIPLFRMQAGKLLFWERGHFHFTPLGCQLVGQVLCDEIVRGGFGG